MASQSGGPAQRQSRQSSVQRSVSVLVAESDELLRQVLRDLFEEEGYAVREATDGRQALEILRTSQERLVVVLDHVLPLLSGEEVLDAVAKDRRLRRRHAFVLVSAAPHLSHRLRLMRLLSHLAVQRIDKPFDLDVLLDAVTQATRRILGAPQGE